jgi:hypothetical protein
VSKRHLQTKKHKERDKLKYKKNLRDAYRLKIVEKKISQDIKGI